MKSIDQHCRGRIGCRITWLTPGGNRLRRRRRNPRPNSRYIRSVRLWLITNPPGATADDAEGSPSADAWSQAPAIAALRPHPGDLLGAAHGAAYHGSDRISGKLAARLPLVPCVPS